MSVIAASGHTPVEAAERDGRRRPGQTVVECTGGSTGSSLAFVCGVKGYRPARTTSRAAASGRCLKRTPSAWPAGRRGTRGSPRARRPAPTSSPPSPLGSSVPGHRVVTLQVDNGLKYLASALYIG